MNNFDLGYSHVVLQTLNPVAQKNTDTDWTQINEPKTWRKNPVGAAKTGKVEIGAKSLMGDLSVS